MTRLGPLLIGYTRTTTTTYPSNIRVGRKKTRDSLVLHHYLQLHYFTPIHTMLLDCYSGLKYTQCYWSAIPGRKSTQCYWIAIQDDVAARRYG